MSAAAANSPTRTEQIVLALIVLVGLAGRLIGIGYGLPQMQCRPDEVEVLGRATAILTGDPNPHFFNYPSLFLYVSAIIAGATALVCRIMNGPGYDLADFMHTAWIRPEVLFLPVRIFCALIGTLTILAIFRLASRRFGVRTGLIAAFFLAVAPLHLRQSHFALTDVPAAFLLVLAIDRTLAIEESGERRRYITAGLFAGLSAATKYYGAFLAPAIAIAHYLRIRRENRPLSAVLLDRRPWLAAAALAAGFTLTSPYVFLDWAQAKADLEYEARYVDHGYTPIMKVGWLQHAIFTLPYGAGIGLLIGAIAGLIIASASRPKSAAILLAFPAVYYVIAGKGYTVFVRYMLPFVPFIAVFSAVAVDRAAAFVTRRLRIPAAAAGLVLALAAAAPSIGLSVDFLRIARRPDTRVTAAEWIRKNVPNGASLAQVAPPYAAIDIEAPWESIRRLAEAAHPGDLARRNAARFDFDPAAEGRIAVLLYDDTRGVFVDAQKRPFTGLPDYLSFVETFERHDAALLRAKIAASGRYVETASFIGMRSFDRPGDFDRQDSFFIPYRNFDDCLLPGPDIRIYKRK